MTAEAEVHCKVSEVQFEEKRGLNMSSFEALPTVGGDCNRELRMDDELDVNGIGKDDTDHSFVIINRPDALSDDPMHGNFDEGCVEEFNILGKSDGSPNTEIEKNGKLCVEDGHIVDGTVVLSSNNEVTSYLLQGEVRGDKPTGAKSSETDEVIDFTVDQNKILAVESESQQLDVGMKIEEQMLESGAGLEEGKQEPQVIDLEATGYKSSELDDCKLNGEGQHNLEATAESGKGQESPCETVESEEPQLHKLNNIEENFDEPGKTDPSVGIEENQVTSIITTNEEPLDLVDEVPEKGPQTALVKNLEVNLEPGTLLESDENFEREVASGPFSDLTGDKSLEVSLKMSPPPESGHHLEREVANGFISDKTGNYLEVNLEADTFPEINEKLEREDANGSVSDDMGHKLEDNFKVDSSPDSNLQLEGEVANGSTSDRNGGVSSICPSVPNNRIINDIPERNGSSEEAESSLATGSANGTTMDAQVGNVASVISESYLSSADERSEVESSRSIDLSPIDDPKSDIEVEKGPEDGNRSKPQFPANAVRPGFKIAFGSFNCEDTAVTLPSAVDEKRNIILPACPDAKVKCVSEFEKTSAINMSNNDAASTSSLEGAGELDRRPFNFLVRVPRYDDEKLKKQIEHFKEEVDEKTQSRDAIQRQIQMKRATCVEYHRKFESVKSEERAVRDLFKSKRQEMDSVQSVINKVKNAMSIEDIDNRIYNIKYTMEHETVPLKEEKQFIREIKQLTHLREQITANMGRQDEVQQALDQREQIEERLKLLKKEVNVLKNNVLRAEEVSYSAWVKYADETEMVKQLQAQFKFADSLRQEAWVKFQSLKKHFYEKNKYYRNYKEDAIAANDYASKGDREGLERLCGDQVERIMELWNNNDEFREDYVRCNQRSYLWRFKTLDGRKLGIDEAPTIVPNIADEPPRAVVDEMPTKEEKPVVAMAALKAAEDDKYMAKALDPKNQKAKATKENENKIDEVAEANKEEEEEHKQAKEEEELARKAEELRKEVEAAKLKELRRLEEKTKALEAQERKKRTAERAQAKAELRARKEAEQREKEREKKARKKGKKKGAENESMIGSSEVETALCSQTPNEISCESESREEKPVTVTKRSQKPSKYTKAAKAKSIPPPLRNRGKRKVQSWMWILLACFLVIVLFFLGKSSLSFKFGPASFGY